MGIFEQSFGDFLGELGSAQPSPGGGAAAAMSGAMAAALVSKVAHFSRNHRKALLTDDQALEIARGGDALGSALMLLADEDASAYGEVAAFKRCRHPPTPRRLPAVRRAP